MRITAEKDGFRIENGGGVPLIAELRLTAGFDGREVEAKNWRSCGPDRFEAENGGIRIRAGESLKELVLAKDAGCLITGAIAAS